MDIYGYVLDGYLIIPLVIRRRVFFWAIERKFVFCITIFWTHSSVAQPSVPTVSPRHCYGWLPLSGWRSGCCSAFISSIIGSFILPIFSMTSFFTLAVAKDALSYQLIYSRSYMHIWTHCEIVRNISNIHWSHDELSSSGNRRTNIMSESADVVAPFTEWRFIEEEDCAARSIYDCASECALLYRLRTVFMERSCVLVTSNSCPVFHSFSHQASITPLKVIEAVVNTNLV